jgi:hypothetical protein
VKIRTITVRALRSPPPDHESEMATELTVSADLEDGDDFDTIADELQIKANAAADKDHQRMLDARKIKERALDEPIGKVSQPMQQYYTTAMVSQFPTVQMGQPAKRKKLWGRP